MTLLRREGVQLRVPAIAVLVLALCALALGNNTTTANADEQCVEKATDPSTACVNAFHTVIQVCDRDADGHRVFAHIRQTLGGSNITTGYDANDSAAGCSGYAFQHRRVPGVHTDRKLQRLEERIAESIAGASGAPQRPMAFNRVI